LGYEVRAAVSSFAAGSRRAGVVFAAAGFAAPMTAPERVKHAAFFLPPRAMIFALFFKRRVPSGFKERSKIGRASSLQERKNLSGV
jgi:hypothetical protein